MTLKRREKVLAGVDSPLVAMQTVTMTDDAPARATLGVAVRARREANRLTRVDVHAAGGPSAATQQRIENDEIGAADLKPATKDSLEDALGLARGWIDAYAAGRPLPETPAVAVVEDNPDGQILVGIIEGLPALNDAELRSVLTLVQTFRARKETQ